MNQHPRQAGFRLVLALLSLLAGSCAQRPDTAPAPALVAVPAIPLAAMDPTVQRQLREQRAQLDELLAADSPETSRLSESFGALGRLYQAYDLPAPAIACYRNAHNLRPEVFRWPYLLGYLLYLEGDLDEAAKALGEALRLRPQDPPANLWAGHAALGRGDGEVATRLFQQALDADATCAGARFGLGEAARDRGDLEAAVAHYRGVLGQQPQAVRVHYSLAQALRGLDRGEEAREHFAVAADPSATRGGWAGCADPEIAAVTQLASGSAAAILRGSGAGAEGSIAGEIAAYRAAVAADPGDAIARRTLGSALWDAGDAEGATQHLAKALEISPDEPTIHYDLGFILAKTGDLERSEQHLQRAIALYPDYPEAHLMLGTLYQRSRLFQPALHHYDRVLARDPDLIAARLQRALTLGELARRPEALADLRRLAAENRPRAPEDRLNLASALGLLGDAELAGSQLLELTEDSQVPATLQAQAHFNLGMLALERRAPREAIPHFQTAGELAPEFEPAARGLREAQRQAAQAG